MNQTHAGCMSACNQRRHDAAATTGSGWVFVSCAAAARAAAHLAVLRSTSSGPAAAVSQPLLRELLLPPCASHASPCLPPTCARTLPQPTTLPATWTPRRRSMPCTATRRSGPAAPSSTPPPTVSSRPIAPSIRWATRAHAYCQTAAVWRVLQSAGSAGGSRTCTVAACWSHAAPADVRLLMCCRAAVLPTVQYAREIWNVQPCAQP